MKTPRLKKKYQEKIIPELKKQLGYTSPMQVPKLEKIVINQGLGEAIGNAKILENALEEITLIAGQKAVSTKAKKSISNFKLREGMAIGAKVTLRSHHMYEFLDRLITISLPRSRDFKGISPKGFDQQGNYTLGIKEQIIFLEISMDKVSKLTGMNITFVTSCKDQKISYALLKAFGLPFKTS
ncbi:MAG: 50S ribosomal protein L5 [Bacteroidota bacterium]